MKLPVYNIEGKNVGREVELPADIFGLEITDQINHVLYLSAKQYLANQRQGTHKSKQRNEIHGSTRKLHRQKGTGGSRKGNIKSPLFHGGGRVFGPQPRNYEQKLNKKVKRLARKAALSIKAQQNRIIVLEDFRMETPKTKNYLNILNSLGTVNTGVNTSKSLMVLNAPNAPVLPVSPRFPQPPRGRKKRAAYADKVKEYISKSKQYKVDLQAYQSAKAAYDQENAQVYGNIHLSARNVPKTATAHANMLNTYEIMNTNYLVISESALEHLKTALS